jgi:hypothetical protein
VQQTIAQIATIHTSATSVNRRPENGDDTRSKINDTFENEQAPLLTAAGRAYTGYDRKDAIDEHAYKPTTITSAPTAVPGVSRQINSKMMPKMPRKPTAHQCSARSSPQARAVVLISLKEGDFFQSVVRS